MKKLLLCLLLAFSAFSWAQQEPSGYPQQFEGDWNVPDFTFHSGEKLAQLRLHYITLGSPVRDGTGHVSNAILILHGTGGIGRNFLSAEFGRELFGKGQPNSSRPNSADRKFRPIPPVPCRMRMALLTWPVPSRTGEPRVM